eukprot:2702729-Pyramimonas_sp.AAC.1
MATTLSARTAGLRGAGLSLEGPAARPARLAHRGALRQVGCRRLSARLVVRASDGPEGDKDAEGDF